MLSILANSLHFIYKCSAIALTHVFIPAFAIYSTSKVGMAVGAAISNVYHYFVPYTDKVKQPHILNEKYQLAFYIGNYAFYSRLYCTYNTINIVKYLKFYWFGITPITAYCIVHDTDNKKVGVAYAYETNTTETNTVEGKKSNTFDPIFTSLVPYRVKPIQCMNYLVSGILDTGVALTYQGMLTPYSGKCDTILCIYTTAVTPDSIEKNKELSDNLQFVDCNVLLREINRLFVNSMAYNWIVRELCTYDILFDICIDDIAALKYAIYRIKASGADTTVTPVESTVVDTTNVEPTNGVSANTTRTKHILETLNNITNEEAEVILKQLIADRIKLLS